MAQPTDRLRKDVSCGETEPGGYGDPMLRDGPIPTFLHGLIEYAAGVPLMTAAKPLMTAAKPPTTAGLMTALRATRPGKAATDWPLPVAVSCLLSFSSGRPRSRAACASGLVSAVETSGRSARTTDP